MKLLLKKWLDGGVLAPKSVVSLQTAARTSTAYRYAYLAPLKSCCIHLKGVHRRVILHMRNHQDARDLVKKLTAHRTSSGALGTPKLFFNVANVWFRGADKPAQQSAPSGEFVSPQPAESARKKRRLEVSLPDGARLREHLRSANVDLDEKQLLVAVAAINMVGLDEMEALLGAMRSLNLE
ncbi:hypothetical protein BC832DRAFT_553168 [Gaertneriomyces semiglobifer]|nr:hypothetical protein BC832DRAFT_553168 [Gaertneriomyces semiglobifer]